MSSLKEIKKRINSIKSTRKTTSAMKMVSSAKLHKAEKELSNLLPYSKMLSHYLESMSFNLDTQQKNGNCTTYDKKKPSLRGYSPSNDNLLIHERQINNVAIIAFASDSSLCGAFNANVSRKLQRTIEIYKKTIDISHIFVYTIGKKIYESIRKTGIPIAKNFENMAGKADYKAIAHFAASLIAQYETNKVDRIELIYHHYKSAGSQELVTLPLLPFIQPTPTKPTTTSIDYIIEPSRENVRASLIPAIIKTKLYAAMLHSNTSEHAARMIAMQTATDNADDLVSELTIEYNKSRQQAITNELLDLIGGSAK